MRIKKQIAAFLALWAIGILGTSIAQASQITVPSASGANQYLVSSSTGQYVATTTLQTSKLSGLVNTLTQTDIGTVSKGFFFSTTSTDAWGLTKSYITGIAWGAITGTLSAQADLDAAFKSKIGTSSALTTNQVVMATGFNTVTSTSTIFIASNQTVGINTTNPTGVNANAKLTVAGISSQDIIASTTDNTTLSDAILQAYAPQSRIFMGAHGINQTTIRYGITLGGWGEIGQFNTSGNTNGLIIGTNPAVPLVFGTNNLERLRLTSAGNVGISSTSPFALLSVAGLSNGTVPLFSISTSTTVATTTAFNIDLNGNTTIGNNGSVLTVNGATSTHSNGVDISTGCFSISGSCLQSIISSASAYKAATTYASTTTLPANVYNNGTNGVGATLTGVGNGPFYIDGNAPGLSTRVLVKNEATGANNGIYTLTTVGVTGLTPYVLTRATDYNSNADVFPGVANYVNSGTVNANTCWILSNVSAVTIGTTALTYTDDCGAGSFTGTYPIIITGTTISEAWGTTTANTWSGLQSFSNAGTTTFSGGLYASQIAAPYFIATSTTATSTGANGWNLTAGCFSIKGTCVSASASTPGGTGTELQYRNGSSFGALTPSSFDSGEGDLMIGTTSPTGQLNIGVVTIGSSTEAQEVWSDNNPTSALWAVRNSGGTLSFATSTLNATSSWNALTLYPQGKVVMGLGVPNVVSATLQLYEQNGTGQSPSFLMGGNTGGDTDYWFGRNSNNDGLDNDTLQIGANSTAGNNTSLTLFNDTRVAFGTTTPGWSAITISSSTRPQLTITDGVPANFGWTMRAINNNFFLATSTATGTSTSAAFSISNLGNVTIPNTLTLGTLSLTNTLVVTNASTTNLTASQSLFAQGNRVSGERYPVWPMGTSTAWTGTTTLSRVIAQFAGTLGSISCATDVGTLNVQVKVNSTNVTPMFNASTTKGTVIFTGSNTFVKGDTLEADFGTPATLPTFITCTGIATGY